MISIYTEPMAKEKAQTTCGNSEILIRLAQDTDADFLVDFNTAMALETEHRILPPDTISTGVRNLLRHPEWGFYIVAESEGRVVGCLMITYEWSDWRNGLFWWVQSVYIRPEFRRRGIYRRMDTYIRRMAKNAGNVCGLRLYVDRDNLTAQMTYGKLGMSETHYLLFETTELENKVGEK